MYINDIKPILKWAGGKSQLLDELSVVVSKYDLENHTFFEPFVGGGSVFMYLKHNIIAINDYNEELINVYTQIKNNPKKLIEILKTHEENHCKEYYYEIREWDRNGVLKRKSDIQKAARTIYLNRTCYNGLYRVNANGEFNVPYGRYKNPNIVQEEKIMNLSKYLNNIDVSITCGDFEESIKNAKKGDVIYFDPPYDYEIDNSGFSGYTEKRFFRDDLKRLKLLCDKLVARGCHVIVSNNDTKFVNQLFKDDKYKIKRVIANRMINCDGNRRSNAKEVVIYDK